MIANSIMNPKEVIQMTNAVMYFKRTVPLYPVPKTILEHAKMTRSD